MMKIGRSTLEILLKFIVAWIYFGVLFTIITLFYDYIAAGQVRSGLAIDAFLLSFFLVMLYTLPGFLLYFLYAKFSSGTKIFKNSTTAFVINVVLFTIIVFAGLALANIIHTGTSPMTLLVETLFILMITIVIFAAIPRINKEIFLLSQ